MKKLCVILLCLLTVHSAFAVERWAIVIGIGHYPAESGWNNNINGDKDIEIIVPMLRKLGFPQENIITLKNQSATKHNIKNSVYKDLIPKLHNGDIVYFHFSGHGQLITDLDGDEDDGWDEAMIPYDAKSEYSAEYKGENHIVDDELNDWLLDIYKKIGVNGKMLVILDACHSGGGSRDAGDDIEEDMSMRGAYDRFEISPNYPTVIRPKRDVQWICISACQSRESNYEYEAANGKKYGRLSWCLSKILTNDLLTNELEEAVTRQYQLLPPMPFPQTVHMEEIPTYLSNQTVL